jgi:hypothetical protein
MSTAAAPENAAEALAMIHAGAGYLAGLAGLDATAMPAAALGAGVQELEWADGLITVARAQVLAAHDAKDGHLAHGYRATGSWLFHGLRLTRAQVARYQARQGLARKHRPLLAGLRTRALNTSLALQLAQWTMAIPAQYRAQAEDILVAAAWAGAGLRSLAQICAEIKSRTAPPDPGDQIDPPLDRALFLDTAFDGAGVLHADLTPECTAMVQAVLDALAAPAGAGDLRTRLQHYHDALAETMRWFDSAS